MQLIYLKTHEEIASSFKAFLELRPHLTDLQSFLKQIENQQTQGYEIVAIIEDTEIVACLGFRIFSMLAFGKVLYIDDLITKEKCRGRGYATVLLNEAKSIARKNGCDQIHLDTGYTRHAAHRIISI